MPSFSTRTTDPDCAARISNELGIHPVTAQVLCGRGIREPDRARSFLRPSSSQLHEPLLFQDMERATGIVAEAIRAGDLIAVYGDYDVDGVSSTAILMRTLTLLGAAARPFIPHRVSDGFGLSGEALMKLRDEGCSVVVTVDNGTTRAAEIARAREAGLEVIVTDHHEPGAVMPDCPLINPKRPDTTYPFPGLAGCGVAFKFATALAERLGQIRSDRFRKLLPDLMALVAIGTVADVVPLVDENRSLVATGLKALAATSHEGLRALLSVARCDRRPVRTADIAFRLGPRLNAAGRIDSAQSALDLLVCEDAERASELARQLDAGNRERQRIDRRHSGEAFERAGEEAGPAVVLADRAWHPGVIGIVAARVAETFRRPAVMIAIAGDEARGSARSWGGVRLHEALERCAAHLRTHGGHAFAAGFTLATDRIEAFRAAFQEAVAAQDAAGATQRWVDAELPIEAITVPLATEIESLQPFGSGNEEPVFGAYGLRVAGKPRLAGTDDRHLIFYAADDRASVRAVAFRQADREPALETPFDLAFTVRRRNGPEPVEIHVREIVPSGTD